MTKTFTLEPFVGALPIKFGMSERDVIDVLGPSGQVETNYLGERSEQRDAVGARYSKETGAVVEVSFLPRVKLLFRGRDLFKEKDLIKVLLTADPHPYEWVGFVIFLALGIGITGYHDGDTSQRAITVCEKGRWDAYRDQFSGFKDAE